MNVKRFFAGKKWLSISVSLLIAGVLVGLSVVCLARPSYATPTNSVDPVVAHQVAENGILNSAGALPTMPAWTGESNQTNAYFGYSVNTAGDVNGDGFDDVIVGAYAYDITGTPTFTDAGRAYVYYGSGEGLSQNPAWIFSGDKASAYVGVSVGTAGDVNGDGYADVVVGANGYNVLSSTTVLTAAGRLFVFYGSPIGLSTTPSVIINGDQVGEYLGYSVSTAGDVNDDGYADVVATALLYDKSPAITNTGAAILYLGSSAGLITNTAWLTTGSVTNEWFGYAISTAGDVNGDGHDDVIVGDRYFANGQTEEGAAFVYHGTDTGLNATPNWQAESNQSVSRFGMKVGTAGDVNGDGYDEAVVGAYQYDHALTDEGAAFVWFGSASGLGANGTPANADWIAYGNQTGVTLGSAVGTAGDVDGDGYSDLLIGADLYPGGKGGAFVYLGSASGLGPSGNPGNADWLVYSDQGAGNPEECLFGWAASTAGDVNGDRLADVIVGAYKYDHGEVNEGRAFVYQQRTCYARLNNASTDYQAIQTAIDASTSANDVVKVAGTCRTVQPRGGVWQNAYLSKSLTLRGGYPISFTEPSDPQLYPTTIDAGRAGRAIYIAGQITATIENLNITQGYARDLGGVDGADAGGGIYAVTATVRISNSKIYSNEAEYGGGLFLGSAKVTINNNAIYSNTGVTDGGGGLAADYGSGTISGNNIHHNTAGYAGGLGAYEATFDISGNTICNNYAGQNGGGIAFYGGDLTFSNNLICANRGEAGGGGVDAFNGPATFDSNTIVSNTTNGSGAGLHIDQSDAIVTGNLLRANVTDHDDGGGAYIENSTATVEWNSIISNTSVTGSGGGLKFEGDRGSTIDNNEFISNTANWVGAGLFVNNCSPAVRHNYFAYNNGNEGSGITLNGGYSSVSDNWIENNIARWRGGGLAFFQGNTSTLTNTVLVANRAAWEGGALRMENSAPTLINSVIIDNWLTENGTGSGLFIKQSAPRLLHTTIANNTGGDVSGITVHDPGNTVYLTNTIVTAQAVGVFVDNAANATLLNGVLWYDNTTNTGGAGSITVTNAYTGTPNFAPDGMHITLGSAAINRGVNSGIKIDFHNGLRIPPPDLGADEFQISSYLPLLLKK